MTTIPISLAAEGNLDDMVLRKLVDSTGRSFVVTACYGKRGKDHLRENIRRFNQAAAFTPFVVLTDLDEENCAPELIIEWLPQGANKNLLFRIAVREVESWLMADRQRFAGFLGVSIKKIPSNPDDCADPKSLVLELVKQSRKRKIREDLLPTAGSTSKVGRNYNGQLISFVLTQWRIDDSSLKNSNSLNKAFNALKSFLS